MTRILFLKNLEQLAVVRAERPELLRSCTVIALTTPLWLMLQQEGCELALADEVLQAGVRVTNLAIQLKARVPWIPMRWKKAVRRLLGLGGTASNGMPVLDSTAQNPGAHSSFPERSRADRFLLAIG